MNDDATFGRYMKGLRQAKDQSLLELSNATGLAYTHLSRIENDSTVPNPDTVVRLAHALEGDLAAMLEKANNLPRAILDRLANREAQGISLGLRRAMPQQPASGPFQPQSLDEIVRRAGLTSGELLEMKDAVEGLVRLQPHHRRLILDLISSYFPEGDDATG